MRKPDWQTDDGSIRLFLGDCREVLASMGAESVEATITDPPYNVGLKYDGDDSQDRKLGYWEWCRYWLTELERVTSGPIAISCGMSNLPMWTRNTFPDWILAWHKPAAMGRCVVGFNNWEPVILFRKPAKAICDVFRACIVPDDAVEGHPCPKPIQWAAWQVENLSSVSVLDPFMGSGTTAVASIRAGRQFVGIEKEPKYFDIAVRRIEAELNRHPLFDEPKPKQREFSIA